MTASVFCTLTLIPCFLTAPAWGQGRSGNIPVNLQWMTARVICDQVIDGKRITNPLGTATVVGYRADPDKGLEAGDGHVYLVTVKHLQEQGHCASADLRVEFPDIAPRPPLLRPTPVKALYQDPMLDFQILVVDSNNNFRRNQMDPFFQDRSHWCLLDERPTPPAPLTVMAYPTDAPKIQNLTSYPSVNFVEMDATGKQITYKSVGDTIPPGSSGGPVVNGRGGMVGIERLGESDNIGLAVDITAIRDAILKSDPTSIPWLLGNVASGDSTSTKSISAGWTHACRLTVDGTAFCWGTSETGALGTGSDSSPKPQRVKTNLKFKDISAGFDHTCAIEKTAGDVYCWGSNKFGQLGGPASASRGTPAKEFSTGGFESITAGAFFTCGIRSHHAVCWGRDYTYDVGLSGRAAGIREIPDFEFVQLSASDDHVCGVEKGGAARCWGFGWTKEWEAPPVLVKSGSVAFEPGTLSSGKADTGACAITSEAILYCWGKDNTGVQERRKGVAAATHWKDEALLLLTTDGTLGNLTGAGRYEGIQTNVREASAGSKFGCLVDACGRPSCWGKEGGSALGTGKQASDSPLPLAPDVN